MSGIMERKDGTVLSCGGSSDFAEYLGRIIADMLFVSVLFSFSLRRCVIRPSAK